LLRRLPAALPSWVIGLAQLSGAQWRELIRLKFAMFRAKLAASRRSGGGHHDRAAQLIKQMGDLFDFSEQHRKIAHAQYQALRRYQPRVYPDRVTLFRARMQPFMSTQPRDKGWAKLAAGGLEVRDIPGNHLGMLQEPHVSVLADQLRACLEQTRTIAAASFTRK
jgi:thioesterase domain-containing protein